jgi:hypothetical protein
VPAWGRFVHCSNWLLGEESAVSVGQLPYMIGQAAMYDALLVSYEGLQRAQVSEKLHRYAPLFPKLDFLKTFSATGTAGGLLVFLIRESGKDLLK